MKLHLEKLCKALQIGKEAISLKILCKGL